MRRRRVVEPRQVIFVGVEGKSDRAFAQLLQRCCEDAGLHLHLDVKPATGGDTVSVVEEAGRRIARHPGRRFFTGQVVLLDRDRLDRDRENGRDALITAAKWRLEVVFQEPNLEGLFLRLHPGCEQRRPTARESLQELRRVWPEYNKPPTADELVQRFGLSDVRRAARHDDELRRLLRLLGL